MEQALTEFNEGGSHVENPLGGIPQGQSKEGVPNSVQEGETKYNLNGHQYVYSNDIDVKESYIDAYSLPSYIEGKTMAEASKIIQKKIDGRTDNASVRTQKALFERLLEAQEMAKLEMAAAEQNMSVEQFMQAQAQQQVAQQQAQDAQQMQAQQQQQNAPQGGVQDQNDPGIPQGGDPSQMATSQPPQQQFEEGGDMTKGIAGGVAGIASLAQQASDREENDRGVNEEKSVGAEMLKMGATGAAAGAAIGSVFPGPGTVIGGAVGAVVGAGVGGVSAAVNNSAIPGQTQDANALESQTDLLKKGFQYEFGGDLTGETSEDEKDTNWMGYAGLATSFAPFVGNMIEGATLKGADPIKYDRVGTTYTPEFADERSRLNIVDGSFAGMNRGLANASNGNIGAYRSNIIAGNAKKNMARGQAYQEIAEINRGERKLVNADRADARKEDVMLTNQERKERQLDDAALTNTKSAYRAAGYEALGEMGKSLFGVAQMGGMTSYDKMGNKKRGPSNTKEGLDTIDYLEEIPIDDYISEIELDEELWAEGEMDAFKEKRARQAVLTKDKQAAIDLRNRTI